MIKDPFLMANKRRQPACIETQDRLRGRARVSWQSPGALGTNDRESTDISSVKILANAPLDTEKQISLSTTQIQEMVSGAFTNKGFIIIADTVSAMIPDQKRP